MNHEPSLRATTTDLIETAENGDATALNQFIPLVYEALRALAHRRLAVKRGEGVGLLSLDDDQAGVDEYATELVDLDDALSRLAECSPRHARPQNSMAPQSTC